MAKVKIWLLALLLVCCTVADAAFKDSTFTENRLELVTGSGKIAGTLTLPGGSITAVALIIAGSGPTDKDGNSIYAKTDALKKLAHGLAESHIASLRYDKRGVAESMAAAKSETDLRFDDYVADARDWIKLLKQDKRFSQVIIVGHSEGSLIGMMAATAGADKFVSIAGAGRPADDVLREQLAAQPQQVKELCFPILDSLKQGKTVAGVNPMLNALFRPSVQPYLISWFKYNPQEEIKKLAVPVLVVQGTNDIQVSAEDAQLLAAARSGTKLSLISNMNHIFRIVTGTDKALNMATYNNPSLPVSEELITNISRFISAKQ